MFKRGLVVLMIVIIVMCSINVYADDHITVKVNGEILGFDQEPVMINDRVLVPLRKICEAIGAEIYWEQMGEMYTITFIKNRTLVTMINGIANGADGEIGPWRLSKYTIPSGYGNDVFIGNAGYIYEHGDNVMEVQPTIINGRTLVPVRVLTESFGADVQWVDESQTVEINIADTEYDRDIEDIKLDEAFTQSMAYDMYMNLPDVKRAINNGEAWSYELTPVPSYGEYGKSYEFGAAESMRCDYVRVYASGKAVYVDFDGKVVQRVGF